MDTQTHILNSPYPQGKFFLIFLHEGGGFVNFNSFNISTISLTSIVKDSKNSRVAFYLDPRHEAGIDEPVDDDLRRPRRVEAGLGDGSHRRRRQKLLKHRKA